MDGVGSLKWKRESTTSCSLTNTAGTLDRVVTRFTIESDDEDLWIVTQKNISSVDTPRPEKRRKTEHPSETVERQEIRTTQNEPSSPGAKNDEESVYLGTSRATDETKNAPSADGKELPVLLDGEECTICFEPYTKAEDMAFLKCFHFFHKDCIDNWMMIDHTCPVCRCPAVIEGNLQ